MVGMGILPSRGQVTGAGDGILRAARRLVNLCYLGKRRRDEEQKDRIHRIDRISRLLQREVLA
jgi:hypothetical protein